VTDGARAVERPLPQYWACPECGRKFVKEGQGHVHGTWTVEEHLEGRSAASLRIYQRFVELLRELGPVQLAPTKAQIGFQTNRIFAGVRLTERGVEGYLDLAREVESSRFRHVAPYTKRLWVHHFVLSSEDDLDDEFAGWMGEAYQVGWGAR
jgi:hypothetical protein